MGGCFALAIDVVCAFLLPSPTCTTPSARGVPRARPSRDHPRDPGCLRRGGRDLRPGPGPRRSPPRAHRVPRRVVQPPARFEGFPGVTFLSQGKGRRSRSGRTGSAGTRSGGAVTAAVHPRLLPARSRVAAVHGPARTRWGCSTRRRLRARRLPDATGSSPTSATRSTTSSRSTSPRRSRPTAQRHGLARHRPDLERADPEVESPTAPIARPAGAGRPRRPRSPELRDDEDAPAPEPRREHQISRPLGCCSTGCASPRLEAVPRPA